MTLTGSASYSSRLHKSLYNNSQELRLRLGGLQVSEPRGSCLKTEAYWVLIRNKGIDCVGIIVRFPY